MVSDRGTERHIIPTLIQCLCIDFEAGRLATKFHEIWQTQDNFSCIVDQVLDRCGTHLCGVFSFSRKTNKLSINPEPLDEDELSALA